MSYEKPIICVKGTAIGDFVEKHDIGWSIKYDREELHELLEYLEFNKSEIESKVNNIRRVMPDHMWRSRAHQVVTDLVSLS